jgi:hypothetical protein
VGRAGRPNARGGEPDKQRENDERQHRTLSTDSRPTSISRPADGGRRITPTAGTRKIGQALQCWIPVEITMWVSAIRPTCITRRQHQTQRRLVAGSRQVASRSHRRVRRRVVASSPGLSQRLSRLGGAPLRYPQGSETTSRRWSLPPAALPRAADGRVPTCSVGPAARAAPARRREAQGVSGRFAEFRTYWYPGGTPHRWLRRLGYHEVTFSIDGMRFGW